MNDDLLFELHQGRRLDRVDNGTELKIGNFTASFSLLKESSSTFEILPLVNGDPLRDWKGVTTVSIDAEEIVWLVDESL